MMTKMKIFLIAVVLFVTIEATPYHGWTNHGSDITNGRRNGWGPPWAYPQQQQDSINEHNYDLKWMCQNPTTNEIMIITTRNDNTQQHPGKRSWWQWQNVPPGHQRKEYQQGNYWTQPIIIVQREPTITDVNQPSLPSAKTPNPLDDNNQPQSTPHYHGGEGQIDIRIGAE